ncbi:MAG: hypothetical protein JNL13_06130 [Chitinophagaceae bacterium]|nr:hypothetical protein [Chitinophagaceae bacterium]
MKVKLLTDSLKEMGLFLSKLSYYVETTTVAQLHKKYTGILSELNRLLPRNTVIPQSFASEISVALEAKKGGDAKMILQQNIENVLVSLQEQEE